jgi:hypothetical protein
MPYRYQDTDWLDSLNGIADALSNSLVSADPETPVFSAPAGMPVRVRMIHPGGNAEQVVTLHGHNWQEEPYTDDSHVIGTNPKSQSTGSRDAFGPNASFDIVLPGAGGVFAVPGDYLLRTFIATDFQFGMWGLLRVGAAANATGAGRDTLVITRFEPVGGNRIMITGVNTVNPVNGQMSKTVTVFSGDDTSGQKLGEAPVDPLRGTWSLQVASSNATRITASSDQNGIVHSGAVKSVPVSTRITAAKVQGVPASISAGSRDDRDPVRNDFRPEPKKEPGSGAAKDPARTAPPPRRPQQ